MEGKKEDAKRIMFVTVGTTSFDALVKAVVSQDVKDELQKRGFTHLLIQLGRGIYFPTKCDGADGSLVVDYFTFSSSTADYTSILNLCPGAAAGMPSGYGTQAKISRGLLWCPSRLSGWLSNSSTWSGQCWKKTSWCGVWWTLHGSLDITTQIFQNSYFNIGLVNLLKLLRS